MIMTAYNHPSGAALGLLVSIMYIGGILAIPIQPVCKSRSNDAGLSQTPSSRLIAVPPSIALTWLRLEGQHGKTVEGKR